MKTALDNVHIGTSGWHYDHWEGVFYPVDLSQSTFLDYYAERFRTVEINNSFYRLPEKKTLAGWRETVPEDFLFSAKASRYLTHMKKLKDPREPLARLLDKISVLGEKLGPILFQLPPRWKVNVERLEGFLEILPKDHRYAFEFRDASWFDGRVYEVLAEHEASFCIYDLDGKTSPRELTADFVYVRLHGPEGPYRGRYSAGQLASWADAFSTWTEAGRTVYCYFDNDEAGYAPQDALRLQQMIEE